MVMLSFRSRDCGWEAVAVFARKSVRAIFGRTKLDSAVFFSGRTSFRE